ncbi:hypothetical protein [Actinoplanes sp. NPDC049118]|uniref:hypothetical protein n=1 Tax=Actinoplanes sp. NPDC049118 TaxID=3155769 RepID=UPI0033CF09EC
MDGLSAGLVAQVRYSDEVTVPGRPDGDQPTAGRDVEDLVDVELDCGHGGAGPVAMTVTLEIATGWRRRIMTRRIARNVGRA